MDLASEREGGCVRRYRQQLAQAVDREQSLQRDKAQVELDWQRRCDDVERELHRRAEDLVQGLTTAREQVRAAHTLG